MKPVADQREGEQRKRTQRQNSSNRETGVLVVRFDRALGGDDGADAANCGTNREQRRELGAEAEGAPEEGHERDGADNLDEHEREADTSELQHIAEKKARTKENDAGLEPELVRSHARA